MDIKKLSNESLSVLKDAINNESRRRSGKAPKKKKPQKRNCTPQEVLNIIEAVVPDKLKKIQELYKKKFTVQISTDVILSINKQGTYSFYLDNYHYKINEHHKQKNSVTDTEEYKELRNNIKEINKLILDCKKEIRKEIKKDPLLYVSTFSHSFQKLYNESIAYSNRVNPRRS